MAYGADMIFFSNELSQTADVLNGIRKVTLW